jgi:hypothetical protein
MNAFEYNGIDYLLKPLLEDELQKRCKIQEAGKTFWKPVFTGRLVQYVSGKKVDRKGRKVFHSGWKTLFFFLQKIKLYTLLISGAKA